MCALHLGSCGECESGGAVSCGSCGDCGIASCESGDNGVASGGSGDCGVASPGSGEACGTAPAVFGRPAALFFKFSHDEMHAVYKGISTSCISCVLLQ